LETSEVFRGSQTSEVLETSAVFRGCGEIMINAIRQKAVVGKSGQIEVLFSDDIFVV
jgi:hypothetical protein